MTKFNRDRIVGGIIVAILLGIPIAVFLGPVGLGVFFTVLTINLIKKKEKPISQKTTEWQKQDEELITTILPITNNGK